MTKARRTDDGKKEKLYYHKVLEAKPCSIAGFDKTLEEFSATRTISPYDDNPIIYLY